MPRAKTTQPDASETSAVDPGLQKLIAVFAMGIVGTVVGTALYGSDKHSERAFRLVEWLRRRPDLEAEPDGRRTPRAKRR
jgi:hypothetical protein